MTRISVFVGYDLLPTLETLFEDHSLYTIQKIKPKSKTKGPDQISSIFVSVSLYLFQH